jgi:uncharacterized glyoxalase superfamily protein PhnB
MPTDPIPAGFRTLTPMLVVDGGLRALDFYERAFGAVEEVRVTAPDGFNLVYATLAIGDSKLLLCDEIPEIGQRGPWALGGSPVVLSLYVADPDALFARAIGAGAIEIMPMADMFWGDRWGKLRDPFGHAWTVAAHRRDPTAAELEAGVRQAFGR